MWLTASNCVSFPQILPFSVAEFLGRAEIQVAEICDTKASTKGPIERRLNLSEVASGEIVLKLDVQLFADSWSGSLFFYALHVWFP